MQLKFNVFYPIALFFCEPSGVNFRQAKKDWYRQFYLVQQPGAFTGRHWGNLRRVFCECGLKGVQRGWELTQWVQAAG